MTDKKHDFAKSALHKTAFGKDISLSTAPVDFKADKPKSKPEAKKDDEEEIEFENPFDEFVKTWQQGDILPFVPPGMEFHLCKYRVNNLDLDAEYLGLQERFRKKPNEKIKKKSSIVDLELKNLGPKLRNSIETVRQRALQRRGGLVPWVDENNKLRCPAGTPAANQFTDEMMSNCFILSPETVAGAGRRAIRRAGAAADILAAKPGGRVSAPTVPGDLDVTTQDGIRRLGPRGAQALMSPGGRVGTQPGIAGAMGSGFGFREDPKKRSAKRAWQLGVKEQLERGRRSTYLSDDLHRRMLNPSGPDGIKLPDGSPVGDIRNKANFVRAMKQLMPNVSEEEIEALFDNALPNNLSFLDKVKFRKDLVRFWEGWIFEAINSPDISRWMTQVQVDTSMGDAMQIKLEPFAPSISTGGRLSSIAAANLAKKQGLAAQGGVHFTMKINPLQMWLASRGYGHSRNGRANGISDTRRGDMLYIATHEFGHLQHFASIMKALGFGDLPDDPTNNRYGMNRSLTPGARTSSGVPAWQPNVEVGGWIVDWTKAQNPMNSQSIAALINAAQNLQTRNYKGGNYGRGIYGFTRADLERDITDFYDGLIEAIHNNITDTEEDRELMRAFAGGEYAALNSIEARAEYYVARRLFGETRDTRERRRLRQGIYPYQNPSLGANFVAEFSDAWAQRPSNQLGGGAMVQTPVDIYADLDRIGENISSVSPGNWNISGRMSTGQNRPTLKARAVRRAIRNEERLADPNSAQWRQRAITGRMSTSTSFKRESSLPSNPRTPSEPLGIITPQQKDGKRSSSILEAASQIPGFTWSDPVPAEQLKGAIDWSTNDIVSQFKRHKTFIGESVKPLSPQQKEYLQSLFVAGRQLSRQDIKDILLDDSNNFAAVTALIREDAAIRGDVGLVGRIDTFTDTVKNMSEAEFRDMLPGLLARNSQRADRRVHVMMENPSLLEVTGEYLTIHDKKERDALGIGYTGFAQEGYTADVRRGVESSFGVPTTETDEITRLRPASGFLPHPDSHASRADKLRSLYGEDVTIMHPYAMGVDSTAANNVGRYGNNMVILRSQVSDRTKMLRGDSAADRTSNGNAALPVNEMLKPENISILNSDTGARLLWDEIVGRGGVNSSSDRKQYNEALVLGSFNLKDDVEAMVVSPSNFDLQDDELSELGVGINPRAMSPELMPTKLVQAARFRDRMRNAHGIDVVVATPFDRVNTRDNKFSVEEVELFNPAMTSRWMNRNFPDADTASVIPDDKTTPYEAFIRYIATKKDPNSASGRILAAEIERLDELKLRTHGEVSLGGGTPFERIDSRGLEDLRGPIRRSIIGKMSTEKAKPEFATEVPELSKRGVRDRRQRLSDSENRVASLEEALRLFDETGEWKGGDLGVRLSTLEDPSLESLEKLSITPSNKTAAELAEAYPNEGEFRKLIEDGIIQAKREKDLQDYLARAKETRIKQNVLDIEDISPEEIEVLKQETAELEQMLARNPQEYFSLIRPSDGEGEFVIHAGSSELENDVLNSERTVGIVGGSIAENTKLLNNDMITKFMASYERNTAIEKAWPTFREKLTSGNTFTIDSPEELKLLQEMGPIGAKQQIGSTINLREYFGENYEDGLKRTLDLLDQWGDRRATQLKKQEKMKKILDENPEGGFLSSYPVSSGTFATRGYFGRYAEDLIPADVMEPVTVQQRILTQSGANKRTIKDNFMHARWSKHLRGTAWLVDGAKDAFVTSDLGPNEERQILGKVKPMFGVSSRKDDSFLMDDIGLALMNRAIQLRKEGKEVTPKSVLEYGRSVTGSMSTGGEVKRPKYPRTPTYGVAIGKGDSLFDDASSWKDFKQLYESKEIVFLDYETTGLVFDDFGKATSNGAPVQIGAVKVKGGKVIDRFNIFINPNEKLGEWSRNNLKDKDGNPLTDEWLSQQPSIAEAHRLLSEFAGADAIMGVQNASFDKNVLEDALKASGIEWRPSGYIDTKEISSMVLPRWSQDSPDGPAKMGSDGIKRPSNGLKEITEYLGVDLGAKHHTADADAEATAEVMQKIIDGAIEKGWSDRIFNKSTRQAHIDDVNQRHLKEIEEFNKAKTEFLNSVEKLTTNKQGEDRSISGKMTTRRFPLPDNYDTYYSYVFTPDKEIQDVGVMYPQLIEGRDYPESIVKLRKIMEAESLRVGTYEFKPGLQERREPKANGIWWEPGNPLYHVTSETSLDSIRELGLVSNKRNQRNGRFPDEAGKPDKSGKVWLATMPVVWDEEFPLDVEKPVFLRVQPQGEFLDFLNAKRDEVLADGGQTYGSIIPPGDIAVAPESIEMLDENGNWVPILGKSENVSTVVDSGYTPLVLSHRDFPASYEDPNNAKSPYPEGSTRDVIFKAMRAETRQYGGIRIYSDGKQKFKAEDIGHEYSGGSPLYHLTSANDLQDIIQNGLNKDSEGGLRPKSNGKLSLVTTPGAWDSSRRVPISEGAVFLRIMPDQNLRDDLLARRNRKEFGRDGQITLYNTNISPDSIEILDIDGKWVPLTYMSKERRDTASKLKDGPQNLTNGRDKETGLIKMAEIDALKTKFGTNGPLQQQYFKDRHRLFITPMEEGKAYPRTPEEEAAYFGALQALDDFMSNAGPDLFDVKDDPKQRSLRVRLDWDTSDFVTKDKSSGVFHTDYNRIHINIPHLLNRIERNLESATKKSENQSLTPQELLNLFDVPERMWSSGEIALMTDRIAQLRLNNKTIDRKRIAQISGYALIIHELAHALDNEAWRRKNGGATQGGEFVSEISGSDILPRTGSASKYGTKNPAEAMAEAFTIWFMLGRGSQSTPTRVFPSTTGPEPEDAPYDLDTSLPLGTSAVDPDSLNSPYLQLLFDELGASFKAANKASKDTSMIMDDFPPVIRFIMAMLILQSAMEKKPQIKKKDFRPSPARRGLIDNPYNEKVHKAFSSVGTTRINQIKR